MTELMERTREAVLEEIELQRTHLDYLNRNRRTTFNEYRKRLALGRLSALEEELGESDD